MSHRLGIALAFAVVSLAASFHAHAGIVYDESVSGDLSGDGLLPTLVSVGVGSNEIFGSTGRDVEVGTDRDYFVISVPTGHEIVALIERAGTTTFGGVSCVTGTLGISIAASSRRMRDARERLGVGLGLALFALSAAAFALLWYMAAVLAACRA